MAQRRHLKKSVKDLFTMIVVTLFSAAILLAFALLFTKRVYVIDFTNQELSSLYAWMENNNINSSQIIIIYEYSETVDEGKIIRQSLKTGDELSRNLSLTIYVSKGTRPKMDLTIPDFNGKSKDEMEKWIEENHLEDSVIYEYQYNKDMKENTILATTPSNGEILTKDGTLFVTISTYNIQSLYKENQYDDYTIETIENWFDEDNQLYEIKYTRSDTIPSGQIIDITKNQNEFGQSITLIVVSSGIDGQDDFQQFVK